MKSVSSISMAKPANCVVKEGIMESIEKMMVSVITPTLNEAECIAEVLREIPKNPIDEILVVDGHSTDGTADIVKELGYKVIQQEGKGYGLAFQTGIKHATGNILVLMDGDGSHNPADIPRLLEKLAEGYDLVLGSRYAPGGHSKDDTLIRYIGNKVFSFLIQLIYRIGISDGLYLFVAGKRKVFESITFTSPNFEFCVEVPIKAHKAGFVIGEIPCIERKRTGGRSKVNAFYHGLRVLWTILRG